MKSAQRGAVTALLDEYKRAVMDLKAVITIVPDDLLIRVLDPLTGNPDCRSIQTILTHVVGSGYSYSIYIASLKGTASRKRERNQRETVAEYGEDLDKVIEYAIEVLAGFTDPEIEESEEDKKIKTRWGQVYDVEQLMEHAIVHILRHRRQIENFINNSVEK